MNKEKHITVIAKVTSACNFNCPYCYTKKTLKQGKFMPIETYEKIIQNIATQYDKAEIIFHGGEPLLVSLDWYRKAIEIDKRYKELYDIEIMHGMQSNLSLLTAEKVEFFKQNEIYVGFSLDGTINHTTRGNTELIIKNEKMLTHMNFKGGCICLITKDNFNEIEKEIDFFDKEGINHKFNVVFNTTTMENNLIDFNHEDLLTCYKKALDHICNKTSSLSEKMFDDFFNFCIDGTSGNLCRSCDCRGRWIGVHPNGDCYPCGQEWENGDGKYKLGNVNNETFFEMFNGSIFKNFYEKVSNKREICSSTCEIWGLCNGSCPGEDKANAGDVDRFDLENCLFMKKFFKYINEFILNVDIDCVNNNYIKNKIKRMRENEKR